MFSRKFTGSLHPSDLAELILWILSCAIIAVHHSSPCTLHITIVTNYHPNNYPQPAPVWPCCSVGRASVIKTRVSWVPILCTPNGAFLLTRAVHSGKFEGLLQYLKLHYILFSDLSVRFQVHLTRTTHRKRINYALTSLPHTTPIGPLLTLTPQRRFSDFSVNISC